MSWSASTPTPVNKDDFTITVTPQTSPEGCDDAFNDQRSAAWDAVALLAKSVGRDTDQITVSMSGHANPDHAPHEGWADEMVTITVWAHPAK